MSGPPAGHPRARRFSGAAGWSLADALLTLALLGLLVSGTTAIAGRVVSDARTAATAREFALSFQALRWKSVSENVHLGLFFERVDGIWQWWEVRDGNGNGLRTPELRQGRDVKASGPHRTPRGVRLGFPDDPAIPEIPPERGPLGRGDPVRFGRADLISFSPRGRSSSGTLFVTDGSRRLFGVRLYGASTRVRVWRWDAGERRWRR